MFESCLFSAASRLCGLLIVLPISSQLLASDAEPNPRPNILWITSEDNSAHWLGCYGNQQAYTPRIDALSAEGVTYQHTYSNAPVCAVARSTLLTGMHAVTIGTHHMRSRYPIPGEFRPYVTYLREAGYYCTNNSKTDYNFLGNDSSYWNDSSKTAHYRNRPAGVPFFAIFNTTTSHESSLFADKTQQYRKQGRIPQATRIDPVNVIVPPLYPDLPEIRRDIATYHDVISAMDGEVDALLDELAEAGLADKTIVFYYSDHGGILPRSKRYVHDSGTHVPLIVRIPEKWRGDRDPASPSRVEEPVGFVDFAPTVLSLAGVPIPEHMQGRAFLGTARSAPAKQDTVFLFGDRFDETYRMLRGVTDGEYRYIHNFYPHLPAALQNEYPYGIASWRAWREKAQSEELPLRFRQFWSTPQPSASLFHISSDSWELEDLINDSEYQQISKQMQNVLRDKMIEQHDLGLLPEPFWHELAVNQPIYEYVRDVDFPWHEVLDAAFAVGRLNMRGNADLRTGLKSSHPVVRYWSAVSCLAAGDGALELASSLEQLLNDRYAANRITAAHALLVLQPREELVDALVVELENTKNEPAVTLAFHTLYQLRVTDRIPSDLLERLTKQHLEYPAEWAKRLSRDR